MEQLSCNTCFVITLIIIIAVLLVYIWRMPRGVERMSKIDESWDKKFHRKNSLIPRDEVYRKYLEFDRKDKPNYVMPMDDKPELGNCVPCKPCAC